MEAKGKDIVCRLFEAENVRYIFGNPGSTEVPLLDNLCNFPNIKYVLALHETIAVAMADGYARASGNPGVASVHAAPGTAHSIGGLYNAYLDNVPVVLISGQQDSRFLIREPFLSADLVSLTRSLTKWSWQVNRGEELEVAMRRAFKEATSSPTGPVFLSLARNVLDEIVESEGIAPQRYKVPPRLRGDAEEIRKAAELLSEAENPVIVAGIGVSAAGAVPELVKLAEVIGARVYAEPGAFPMDHDLYCGPVEVRTSAGQAGSGDVALVVGAKMFAEFFYSPTCTLPSCTKAIHLDSNPWEIAKNCPVDAAIVADPKVGLKEIAYLVQGNQTMQDIERIEQRKAAIADASRKREESFAQALEEKYDGGYVRGARLARDLEEVLDEDAIICDQGTRSSSYLKRFFRIRKPGTYYGERGGSLGWSIAASIGVKLARPDRQVVAFSGDGGTMYYPQALWTAANESVPIVTIILNNGGYSAVKNLLMGYQGEALKQRNFIGAHITGIDYVKMAEGFGIDGIRVEDESRLKPALKEALSAGKPMLLEVMLDPDDTGYGMPRVPRP
ncbi:MAG: thiamine pyrophosphate-binding protein [Chloroflexi bacterium]|nr:thiamine pyrophosphate-binding protein [Chloroflexota bacterium]